MGPSHLFPRLSTLCVVCLSRFAAAYTPKVAAAEWPRGNFKIMREILASEAGGWVGRGNDHGRKRSLCQPDSESDADIEDELEARLEVLYGVATATAKLQAREVLQREFGGDVGLFLTQFLSPAVHLLDKLRHEEDAVWPAVSATGHRQYTKCIQVASHQ
ncbi:hypothetical protein BaRGS_00004151, partial [Batillaria attramentaria]